MRDKWLQFDHPHSRKQFQPVSGKVSATACNYGKDSKFVDSAITLNSMALTDACSIL